MSTFQILAIAASVAVLLVALAWTVRRLSRRKQKRIEAARWLEQWEAQLHRFKQPDAVEGEVASPVEDELGVWFPEHVDPVEPVEFERLTHNWPSSMRYDWRPGWVSFTREWATINVRSEQEALPAEVSQDA